MKPLDFLPLILVLSRTGNVHARRPHRFERVNAPFPLYRCPSCKSVGTFRRYPAITAEAASTALCRDVGGAPERWLCKWCGWWWSAEHGVHQCVPDGADHVWMWRETATDPQPTPMERYARGDADWGRYLQLTV